MSRRILQTAARRPFVAVVAISFAVAGCGGGTAAGAGAAASTSASAATSSASGQGYVVAIATDPVLGAYLTGEDGKTLYVFAKDTAGTSSCTGQCATSWPPFTLDAGETVTGGPGVTASFATIARADGTSQVTYGGAPLYYFSGDAKAGDTTGEGLNGVWFVATPTGARPSASPAASSSAGSSASSGYDGYSRSGSGDTPSASPVTLATASPAPKATATPRPASTPKPTPRPTPAPRPTATPRPTASPAPARASASIVDFGFSPATLTVRAGTTVTWTNTGSAPHTVTADGGGFGSSTLATGASFSHTFAASGTYAYHCAIHSSMTGTIVVTN